MGPVERTKIAQRGYNESLLLPRSRLLLPMVTLTVPVSRSTVSTCQSKAGCLIVEEASVKIVLWSLDEEWIAPDELYGGMETRPGVHVSLMESRYWIGVLVSQLGARYRWAVAQIFLLTSL